MADTHPTTDHHHGPSYAAYMGVAGILAVCTITSFFFNGLAQSGSISNFMSFLLILLVAIIKATLVGVIFMHLKWDWRMVYFIMVPAFIMAFMMVVVLLPDLLFGASRDAAEALQIANEARLQ